MNKVIEVNNLAKAYQLGQFNTGTLGNDLQRWIALARGKEDPFLKIGETNDRTEKGESNIVWSLKNVSFEVERGSAVGIIGRNGAGKSTLLKILSQITGPTNGTIKVKGRIASLLEVGTGFHPELSGKDNIFLNGAILGMRKKEIQRKFDEIVDFSGVERYIDTPVKRYSSGMYVRLAFAVAAHLESEILIVDEVLAVGDAEFQKKCLGKMGEVSKGEGRTVLFVSHNMNAVKQLCNTGIFFENGMIKMKGEMTQVMDEYINAVATAKTFKPFKVKEINIIVEKILLNEESDGVIIPGMPLKIEIEMFSEREVEQVGIELIISHEDTSGPVFVTNTKTRKNIDIKIKKGKNTVTCIIDKFNLCSGKYWLGLGIDLPFILFYHYDKEVLSFEVAETKIEPSHMLTLSAYGHVYLDHEWIIHQ